jgi:hypothetical protein
VTHWLAPRLSSHHPLFPQLQSFASYCDSSSSSLLPTHCTLSIPSFLPTSAIALPPVWTVSSCHSSCLVSKVPAKPALTTVSSLVDILHETATLRSTHTASIFRPWRGMELPTRRRSSMRLGLTFTRLQSPHWYHPCSLEHSHHRQSRQRREEIAPGGRCEGGEHCYANGPR